MSVHVLRPHTPRRPTPGAPRRSLTAPFLPSYLAAEAEVEPRVSDQTIFVHKLEIVDEAGNAETHWFSTKAMITATSDTPASQTLRELIDDPGTYRRQVFNGSRVAGVVAPSWGQVSYLNDGFFDDWLEYATDGGKLTCYIGPFGGAFPSEFRRVFVAYVDGYPSITAARMTLAIRGREKLFDRKVVTLGFTNDLGSSGSVLLEREGIPGSHLKQVVMGTPPPYRPILTNDLEQVFWAHGNASFGTIRAFDGGVELDSGSTIGGGETPGRFNVLSATNGPVLVQPISPLRVELRLITTGLFSSPTVSPRPWTICDLATIAGVTVDAARMAEGSTDYGCGNRVVENQTVKEVLADVAAWQVASIGFTRLDEFYAKPIISSEFAVSQHDFIDGGSRRDGNSRNWKFGKIAGLERRVYKLNAHVGATTKSAFAGIVDDEIRDLMSREPWMTNFTADIIYNTGAPWFSARYVRDVDPTAEIAEVEIVGHDCADETDMEDFAYRFLNVHAARSTAVTLEAPLNLDTMALELLDGVTLISERFGTRPAVIHSISANLKRRTIEFGVWHHYTTGVVAALPPEPTNIYITQNDLEVGAGGSAGGGGVTGGGEAAPQLESFYVNLGDKTTALATGESAQDFIVPYDMTLTEFIGEVSTVQASGSTLTIDVKVNTVSILSVKITIDNNERSSITAATGSAISAPSVLKGDRMTFHIDAVGTGGKGAAVTVIGYQRKK